MLSLSDNNQTDIIDAFNSTSRYLDDLLNIDNPYFEQMVGHIYPTELQLNKANSSDTEAPFLDLNLSITNGIVSSKIYDKRDDFNFAIVNFPFLDEDVPRSHHHYSVIVSVCRGPCARGIYSTHGTPSFMHPLWLQKRNSGCILPLSYAYLR